KKRKSGEKAAPARKKKRVVAKKSAAKKAKPKAKAAAKPAPKPAPAPSPAPSYTPPPSWPPMGGTSGGGSGGSGGGASEHPATQQRPDEGTGRLLLPTGEGADRVRRWQRSRPSRLGQQRGGPEAANPWRAGLRGDGGPNSIVGARRMNALLLPPPRGGGSRGRRLTTSLSWARPT